MLHSLTIFASAFLLFLLQPIAAKQILPWFGGSAAVWTTCLVFFQFTLLLGYAYVDFSVRKLTPRLQATLHIGLLLASLALLPIVLGESWKPTGAESPVWLILALLAGTIGLPYFILSTTSPLVQAWFARSFPARSPYRLFALSNLASMLALLGYPFLLEPWLSTRTQAWGWSGGYVLFVALCALTAYRSSHAAAPAASSALGDATNSARPTWHTQLLWCALAATSSAMLLAVTHHLTQNIAAVPLLWIVPLSLYLISFVLCFDGQGWYRRQMFLALLTVGLGIMGWTLADPQVAFSLPLQLAVFCIGFFVVCMFCHGELVLCKPAPQYLTRFYLMISLGGAAGSILVGILAPLVFAANFDLAIALVVCGLLLLWQTRKESRVFLVLGGASLLFTAACGLRGAMHFYEDTIVTSRNFYGVLRVRESMQHDGMPSRTLIHGTIVHGRQFLQPGLQAEPTSYYTQSSGIGRVIDAMQQPREHAMRVGVIGLGAGTLATYGKQGDVYRFYDINPGVIDIAQRDFTYLKNSQATVELALGDARLSLEREAAQHFDVLAIDAFSSDAIPVHLITLEAVDVYLRHMQAEGVIAFHVSNRYLNLVPVVEGIAHERGLHALLIKNAKQPRGEASSWVLLAKNAAALADPRLAAYATEIKPRRDWRVWADDFNNLVQVLN